MFEPITLNKVEHLKRNLFCKIGTLAPTLNKIHLYLLLKSQTAKSLILILEDKNFIILKKVSNDPFKLIIIEGLIYIKSTKISVGTKSISLTNTLVLPKNLKISI